MEVDIADLNFNINSLMFSLETICIVKVIHHILKASGKTKNAGQASKEIEELTAKRVQKLPLPNPIKAKIESLIKVVNKEIDSFGLSVNPIFTPHGTVNAIESAKAVIGDKKEHLLIRFFASCTLCSVEHILDLGKQLEINQIYRHPRWIQCGIFIRNILWLIVRDKECDGQNIRQRIYDDVFEIAMYNDIDAAVNCALDEVSSEMVKDIYRRKLTADRNRLKRNSLSASTHLHLFSKLSASQQQRKTHDLHCVLLSALLNWPFQHLFLQIARTCMSIISDGSEFAFWTVLSVIADKLKKGFKDYNYDDLFDAFWKLGAAHRAKDISFELYPMRVVSYVFIHKKDDFVGLFLKDIHGEFKKEILMKSVSNGFYTKLLLRREFGKIERLIRGCSVGEKMWLVVLKNKFIKWSGSNSMSIGDNLKRRWKEAGHWEADLRQFIDIVDNI